MRPSGIAAAHLGVREGRRHGLVDPRDRGRPDITMHETQLTLDGGPLTIEQVVSVARGGAEVTLGSPAIQRINAARGAVEERLRDGRAIYGINTGFGSLSRVRIEGDAVRDLQRNLVRSHAAGVGDLLPDDVVRAMMLVLAASLARGHSGVRRETVQTILDLLNRRVTPVVPSRGSVGASGDLAPLAHVALGLMGEGRCRAGGILQPIAGAMRVRDINPVELDAKEGLALINGTHFMTAMAALALHDIDRVVSAATIAAAMAIDACRATDVFLDDRLHAARNQPGPRTIATRLRNLLKGSTILPSHVENDPRVQDPYCLRAAPQVMGAAIEVIDTLRRAIVDELGGVTDNPLVFPGDHGDRSAILSGGNFHGMPIAIPMDAARVGLSHLAGIAERRVNWLVSAHDPQNPVPPYLSPGPGLHSGLMIAQYAAAACCNELQVLAHPASVHNVTTSAGIEDYNSFGATSALMLRQAVERCREVIAIELLVMSEGLEHQRPLKSGDLVERAHQAIRAVVPALKADRPPAPDIAELTRLIGCGSLEEAIASEAER